MLRAKSGILILSIFALAISGFAQNISGKKEIKWSGLSGKNNEFIFFLPEGYQSVADPEYYAVGDDKEQTRIASRRTVGHLVNGVVLLAEIYEGNGEKINKILLEKQKGELLRDEVINGYRVKSFVEKTPKVFRKTQYFQNKKWVYVLKTIANSENNQIAKAFLESVRLFYQEKAAAPNAPQDAKTTSLPKIVENKMELIDDSQIFESKEVDREAIILYSPRPNLFGMSQYFGGQINLKYKLLLSSSGKVSKVEFLSKVAKPVETAVKELLKETKFIPAEKDGKLVSVYTEQGYGWGITTTFR